MILTYVVLALLVASVAWIFAMIAQLAAGLPQVAEAYAARQGGLTEIPEVTLDRPAPIWPSGARPAQDYLIVVLSTSCGTCIRIAAELATHESLTSVPALRMVIVGPQADSAVEFARTNKLGAYQPLIDDGGKWCRDQLGIAQSPALFVVRNGMLAEAYSFGKAADIEVALDSLPESLPLNGELAIEKGHSHA